MPVLLIILLDLFLAHLQLIANLISQKFLYNKILFVFPDSLDNLFVIFQGLSRLALENQLARYQILQQLILLILSDFDPDGEEIAASFPRSLRDDFGLSDVVAHKVAISGDDVWAHGLPSDMEAKSTSPNYRKFVARHGVHVAELDAAPVVLLQGKLRDAIESCLDMELFRAELAKEQDDAAFIAATRRAVIKAMGK